MGGKRRQREEPCHICNHFHDFEGGEPCPTCGHKLASPARTTTGSGSGGGDLAVSGGDGGGAAAAAAAAATAATSAVAEVPLASARPGEIDHGVFFGSYDNAARNELLRGLGITHILSTVPTCNELYRASYVYYTTPEIPPDLRACCEFIARARSGLRGGGNVVGGLGSDVGGLPSSFHDSSLPEVPGPPGRILIHDMTGSTRAPLVAASWLVAARGVSPRDALSAAAAARRPGVAPSADDVQVLSRFARELATGDPEVRERFVRVGQRQQQMHAEHVALMQAQMMQQQQQRGGGGGACFFQQ